MNLPTTESTALQQHRQCLVCDDSFIPAGRKMSLPPANSTLNPLQGGAPLSWVQLG